LLPHPSAQPSHGWVAGCPCRQFRSAQHCLTSASPNMSMPRCVLHL
jgi:hypothetical protein